ncbi:unnamed protein product [Lymnaea stagnalis]|uniref:Large ribosomal subunit protein bL36m n=1 Tax=Lymnaea stagnalis TaxID=6523 RepID=A0AAV2HF44_LYMST
MRGLAFSKICTEFINISSEISRTLMTNRSMQSFHPSLMSFGASSFLPGSGKQMNSNKVSASSNDSSKYFSPLFKCGSFSAGPILGVSVGPSYTQIRGYQNVMRPRLICEGCYFVWRHGRKHVECSDFPRHKQTKKLSPRKIWKEDYTIGKIVKAMDWNRKIHRQFDRHVDRTVMSHNWLADKLGKEI